MSVLGTFQETVVDVLGKDGRRITCDSLELSFASHQVYSDRDAAGPISAERGLQKILVHFNAFNESSEVSDLGRAFGQFTFSRFLLQGANKDRTPYIAIPSVAFQSLLAGPTGQKIIQQLDLKLFVFSDQKIEQWIH